MRQERGRWAGAFKPRTASRAHATRSSNCEEDMLIWINGPFGGGKTQTAYELHARLSGSIVCDPEHIGFGLRRMLPLSCWRGDFQDLPPWRECVRSTLEHVLHRHDGVVIVPMTIASLQYHDEIISQLRRDGFDVRHFTLIATRETVLRRLRFRGEGPRSWAAKQLDRCLEAFERPDTTNLPTHRVADEIASQAGLHLAPSGGAIRRCCRR